MTRLLYIQASPRYERSHSKSVADIFVQTYLEANPSHEVSTLHLFQRSLPVLDADTLQGKYNIMHGQSHSEEDKARWRSVEKVIQEFTAADKYVFAVPMWNFSLPYRLKHYIDVIVQPSYTFAVSEQRYQGLVRGKAYVSYARGGAYPPGSGVEHMNYQSSYVEMILGFMGIGEVVSTVVEPTLGDPQDRDQSKRKAMERAKELATRF